MAEDNKRMNILTDDSIKHLIDLGGALCGPVRSGDGVFQVVPAGWEMRTLEQVQPNPRRMIDHPQLQTMAAFVEYVNEYSYGGANNVKSDHGLKSMILLDGNNYDVLAVLDYHGDKPGFGQHCATWDMKLDTDFVDWKENNDKLLSQQEFALFIEDHLPNVKSPDGAALLEMVQDLELTKNVQFKSQDRLRDGSRVIHYEETVQKSLSRGKIEFPKALELRLPIFRGGLTADITANLRFRVHDGQLGIMFKMMRLQEAIDGNLTVIAQDIAEETNLPVWFGTRR